MQFVLKRCYFPDVSQQANFIYFFFLRRGKKIPSDPVNQTIYCQSCQCQHSNTTMRANATILSLEWQHSNLTMQDLFRTLLHVYMMHVTGKQTLRSLSLSYQKKDGCAWPRSSFFWYDTDFRRI